MDAPPAPFPAPAPDGGSPSRETQAPPKRTRRQTDSMAILPAPPPSTATAGQRARVHTNFWKLNFRKDARIFQYRVDFGISKEQGIDPNEFRGPREKIFDALCQSDLAQNTSLAHEFQHVYDGMSVVYTCAVLPEHLLDQDLELNVETRPGRNGRPGRTEQMLLRLKHIHVSELSAMGADNSENASMRMLGRGGGDVRSMETALEIILRSMAFREGKIAQKNFQAFGEFWRIGGGLAARYGIRFGLRKTCQGPVVFGDIEGGVFHAEMSVTDKLFQMIGDAVGRGGGRGSGEEMDSRAIDDGKQYYFRNRESKEVVDALRKLENMMKTSIKVTLPSARDMAKGQRSKPTKMSREGFGEPANKVTFEKKKRDENGKLIFIKDPEARDGERPDTYPITVAEHQKEQHGIDLRYPDLPVVDFGKKGGKLPMELLVIAPMQPLKNLPPAAQLDNLRRGPGRGQSVQGDGGVDVRKRLLDQNKPCRDKYAEEFGIQLNGGLMEADARILDPPFMGFGPDHPRPRTRGAPPRPVERGGDKTVKTPVDLYRFYDPRSRDQQPNANWADVFQSKQFFEGGRLDGGIAVFVCGRYAGDRGAEHFLKKAVVDMANWCLNLGMTGEGLKDAARNGFVAIGGARDEGRALQEFGGMLSRYSQEMREPGAKPGLVLVVVPGSQRTSSDDWRGVISFLADYKFGVRTVRFREDKVDAGGGGGGGGRGGFGGRGGGGGRGGFGGRGPKTITKPDILDNVAQKMNVKCCGVNAGIFLPNARNAAGEETKPLYNVVRDMAILGLDVNREGGLRKGSMEDSTSIVGMCCSLPPPGDVTFWKNKDRLQLGTRYVGETGLIEGGKEAVSPDEMCRMTKALLHMRKSWAKDASFRGSNGASGGQMCAVDTGVDGKDFPAKPEEAREFAVREHLPRWIVMIRDGVGREQFRQVIENEVEGIRKGLRDLVDQKELEEWKPRLTVIIAQKRGVRLFPASSNVKSGFNGNVVPGTVVDVGTDAPTDAGELNFFLNSHQGGKTQGSNRIPSYTVLVDEVVEPFGSAPVGEYAKRCSEEGKALLAKMFEPLTYDMIETFMYNLTVTYGHCAIGQRQPTPCLYAHQIALRAQNARKQALNWMDPNMDLPREQIKGSGAATRYELHPDISKYMYW